MDFRELREGVIGKFDAIITSPPFLGMRFDRPNWLRLWFCGWDAQDFHETSRGFLERQQSQSTECYRDFFQTSRRLLNDSGILIMHIGSDEAEHFVNDLRRISDDAFLLVAEVKENVQAIEQHGIRDKGLTTHHHLLFMRPR